MKILFLHGWHSVPGGDKPTYLAQHGHEVINPKLPDDYFTLAVGMVKGNDEFKAAAEKTIEIILDQLKMLKTKKSDW